MRPTIVLALLAAAAAPALARDRDADSQAALQKQLAGLVPGKSTSCISQMPSNQSQTFNGAILYKVGGTTYVNRFDGSCQLRPDFDILVTSTPSTQLCRGDTAQIIDQAARFPRGFCIYGDFETYTRPKKAK